MTWADLSPALPEIFLTLSIFVLLLIGLFRGETSAPLVTRLGIAVLFGALMLTWRVPVTVDGGIILFNGLFVQDMFAQFVKSLLLIGAMITLLMGQAYGRAEGLNRFEFPVLTLLAMLGTLLMVSSNDMMSLYVGLELQSLALYVLAAFQRDNVRSSEAGLKYFVLGALSSGALLYGISLIYGFTGTTNFAQLGSALAQGNIAPATMVGIVFVLSGIAFKLSAVPFHMWTPDVYEGAPTPVSAFFAAVPKVAAMALLLRLSSDAFGAVTASWQQIVMVMSVLSMLLGSFAALKQTNIKRLMAYSSIGHVGYALVGLAAGGEAGYRGVLIYMAIYFMMSLGAFAVILCLRRNGRQVEQIADLSGLGRSHKLLAIAMVALMFSMAGVPPLAGFFGKFYVFMAALESQLYTLAVIGVLTSAVSAFYYLRIIKVMYFDEATDQIDPVPERSLQFAIALVSAYLLLFAFYPSPLLNWAAEAARSLLI